MASYDQTILQEMADRLYAQAARVVATWTFLGAVAGVIAGLLKGGHEPLGWIILGVVVGGVAGFLLAQNRAFMLKLQAQTILVQVQIEQNTRLGAVAPSTRPSMSADMTGPATPGSPPAPKPAAPVNPDERSATLSARTPPPSKTT
jgi:uncharacterized membrane protein YeaQ/YmgE (transglycosylase-associated protein family)